MYTLSEGLYIQIDGSYIILKVYTLYGDKMDKKQAIETIREYMGKTPKGYEWCVVTTGIENPDEVEITIGLIKKEGEN